MQYELLTQKLNKMDNEKILLDALNTFGNFTSVEQEFNYNQLEVIYEAMSQVLHIANVVGRSEQLCECKCEYPIIRTGVTEYCSICQLEVK